MSLLKNKLLISSLLLLSANSFANDDDDERHDVVMLPSLTTIEGNIKFKGAINDSSCDISQESKAIEIDLGNHSAALLKKRGDRTQEIPFDIVIADCSISMSYLKIKMTGTAHKDDANLFALNSDEQSAGNVGIAITNISDNQLVTPAAGDRDIARKNDSRDYTLSYSAAYQATGLATPGLGNAIVDYTVTYQ